jgi:hypothetical protein
MSYIRPGHKLKYVKGITNDYVLPATTTKGKEYIEDYDNLSKEGLCEILCGVIDKYYEDPIERKYFMKQLASKLEVELRKKPLKEKY